MIKKWQLSLIVCSLVLFSSRVQAGSKWITEKHKHYFLHYSPVDKQNVREYSKLIDNGMLSVQSFFDGYFKNNFEVSIHPDRKSLDTQWQADWKMPDFKSECWMVASGVADKLDMISPKLWDTESCEHIYSEKIKTQQLITHELVHVYHGQLNASPDFSDVSGIDWFVEGLAAYASGQCDSAKIDEIKKSILNNKYPASLDEFWTGRLKYGLSGSIVLFIDRKYGRTKLKELLKFNKKSDILTSLNISEPELLTEWKEYILHYPDNH
ncbi:MAG: hypothetical protein WCK34_11705 [Bacteroidota bacterium]